MAIERGVTERLRRLRGDTAPAVEPAAELARDPGPDLAARLHRLGLRVAERGAQRTGDDLALADRLGAERLAPGVLRVERTLPLTWRHGARALGEGLGALPGVLDGLPADPARWFFLDTETSGLAGGTGTWAFLCGIARIAPDQGRLIVRQYLLTRLDAEAAYLGELHAGLAGPGSLITYNGKAFDLPLLASRLRLARLPALDQLGHLDLLFPVRRAFATVWPDCRLATAEARLLGVVRRGDLPGSAAPEAWLTWLRRGDADLLVRVLAHNQADLLSLVGLLAPLEATLRGPVAGVADVLALARHWCARGEGERALAILAGQRGGLDVAGRLMLARLYRRRGDWVEARGILEPLAALGDPRAIEGLAKLLEHRAGDYRGALTLAERLPAGPERERRCRRLRGRVACAA